MRKKKGEEGLDRANNAPTKGDSIAEGGRTTEQQGVPLSAENILALTRFDQV
jgi:hypothetical protein